MTTKGFIYVFLAGLVAIMITGGGQAAELSLDTNNRISHDELRDGTRLATGRIICREQHAEFQIWIHAREDAGHHGHYILQGIHGSHHELRVRVEGDGWSVATDEMRKMVKVGSESQATFAVVVDGGQQAFPDRYDFSIAGNCVNKTIHQNN